MNADIKNSQFLKEFCELDLNYFISSAHMYLVNLAFENSKTKKLAEKLHLSFVSPIFYIVKNKMMHTKGDIYL